MTARRFFIEDRLHHHGERLESCRVYFETWMQDDNRWGWWCHYNLMPIPPRPDR